MSELAKQLRQIIKTRIEPYRLELLEEDKKNRTKEEIRNHPMVFRDLFPRDLGFGDNGWPTALGGIYERQKTLSKNQWIIAFGLYEYFTDFAKDTPKEPSCTQAEFLVNDKVVIWGLDHPVYHPDEIELYHLEDPTVFWKPGSAALTRIYTKRNFTRFRIGGYVFEPYGSSPFK